MELPGAPKVATKEPASRQTLVIDLIKNISYIAFAAALSGVRSMHRSSDMLARFPDHGRPTALAHAKVGCEICVIVRIPTGRGSASAEHKSVGRKCWKCPEISAPHCLQCMHQALPTSRPPFH